MSTAQVIAEGRIADAYLAVAEPGQPASLRAVRERLAGMDRGEADRALLGLYRAGALNLVPASHPGTRAEVGDAAIRAGGEDKHLVIWD